MLMSVIFWKSSLARVDRTMLWFRKYSKIKKHHLVGSKIGALSMVMKLKNIIWCQWTMVYFFYRLKRPFVIKDKETTRLHINSNYPLIFTSLF